VAHFEAAAGGSSGAAAAGAAGATGADYAAPPSSGAELLDTFRATIGMGLVFPLPVGNIEVNYVKTLHSRPHDRVKDGLQVGLATQMSM
jgi:outer membrane protein insertion porin family